MLAKMKTTSKIAIKEKRARKLTFLSSMLAGIVCLCLFFFTGCLHSDSKPTGGEIYTSVSPSVFFIEVELDNGGKAGGSAFFIDDKGTAVTNYHVIKGGVSATATLSNGKEYEVTKVLGKDKESDLVVIKVDIEKSKPVKIANSNTVKTGDKVYAIGYPEAFKVGIENSTFTDGIISKNSFFVDGSQYIQTNVDITHGNSGGVLLNDMGEAIGITTAKIDISGVDYMNLALPINNVARIDKTEYNCSLAEFTRIGKQFTVTFMDNEKVYTTQTILNGEFAKEEKINTPKQGYQFVGWGTSKYSSELFDFTTPIQSDITLYAVWKANTYDVVFCSEEEGVTGVTEKITATYDCAFTLPECGFIREGYFFVGWKYDGKVYQAGDRQINLTPIQAKEIIFTAEWEQIVYYTVQFKNTLSGAEGELPQNISAVSGTPFQLPAATLTAKGFRLVGWEYKGTAYAFGESVDCLTNILNSEVVINTRWERIVYPITFDYNLSEYYQNTTASVAYQGNLTLPEILEEDHYGYDFDGWYYNGTLYKDVRVIENFYSPNKSERIVAKWTPHTYQLTYIFIKSDIEFETKTEQITYGTGYTLPTKIDGFMKDGYKIVGWEWAGKTFTAGEKFKPVADNNTQFELYAQFGPISFQYIFLDPYGKEYRDYENGNLGGTCQYGEDFTKDIREYFYFTGYMTYSYKLLDENRNVYEGDVRYICKTDGATVYVLPDWQETGYMVRFENVDPTKIGVEVITVKYSEEFTLKELSKPGFVFKGWQRGSHMGGTGPIYPAGTKFSKLSEGYIDPSMMLEYFYALWDAYSYTIDYDGNGAQLGVMADQEASSNEKVTLTKNAFKKSGSVFGGWIWKDVILEDESEFVYTPNSDGEVVVLKAYWVSPLTGAGTESSPYLIENYQDLYSMSFLVESSTGAADAYYSLTCDIDCEGKTLYAIGTDEKPFKGVFLGNQHKIVNPCFKAFEGRFELGLFGYVKEGKISKVGIENYQISATQGYICAPLVCNYISSSALENCYADGEITLLISDSVGNVRAGGLVGYLQANIKNCRAEGKISLDYDLKYDRTKEYYIGGMSGVYYASSTSGTPTYVAENCYADVDLSVCKISCQTYPRIYMGGFIGNTGRHTFKNCVAKGDLYSEINGVFINRGRFVGGDYITTYENCLVSSDSSVMLEGAENSLPTGVTEQTEQKLHSLTYLEEYLGFDRALWKEINGKIYLFWEVQG